MDMVGRKFRSVLESRLEAGQFSILPDDIIEIIKSKSSAELELDKISGSGRRDYAATYKDSRFLSLCVYQYANHEPIVCFRLTNVGDEMKNCEPDLSDMSIHQARDVSKNAAAIKYLFDFENNGGEDDYAEWLESRESTIANTSDLKKMKLPPWVMAAKEDLEATSAMFAMEFTEKLYPRLIHCKTTSEQLAEIRQAFIETVEAA